MMEQNLTPLGMFSAADWVVKTVMLLLMLASFITWAVFIFKYFELAIKKRKAKQLLATIAELESFAQRPEFLQTPCSGLGMLVQAVEMELHLSAKGHTTDNGLKERVCAQLERVQARLLAHANIGTGVLASIGSVAPFVGLFGTVWGIMNSFIGIAETQTTSLAVVAPGIAEALLATAMGLVAAIPAVILYNYFARSLADLKERLLDIATTLMTIVSRDLDRQAGGNDGV